MAHRTWLCTIAVASLLLTGCAATAAEPPATPEASHTMPDGTVMPGSEHEGHGGDDAGHESEHESTQGPSEAARMICEGQVVTAVGSILQLEGEVTPSSAWQSPMFTCTYDIDGAPLVLAVHDISDADEGQQHFDELQSSLGASEIEGMLGLGLPSFSTGDGVVSFLRDGKTLTVDATALPDGFAGDSTTQDEAAYAVASAVLTCWGRRLRSLPQGLRARFVVSPLTPGMRVVVRYRLPSGQATDALGILLSTDEATLVVEGKRGIERIAVGDVIAAKQVPPPPEPRARRS